MAPVHVGAHPPADLEAADVGEVDVEHDEVGPVVDGGDSLEARRRLGHDEARALERAATCEARLAAVVDDEDARARRSRSRGPFERRP